MTYIPQQSDALTDTELRATPVLISEEDVQSLLSRILKQLKLMNLHLAAMTDEKINGQDIGD